MLINEISGVILVFVFLNHLNHPRICTLKPTLCSYCDSLLATTLYELTPWIMLGIALWGLARLFRRDDSSDSSDIDQKTDWQETDSSLYEDFEEEDEYEDDEEE